MLDDKTILITGGTGSFGKAFTKYIFENYQPRKVIIYSRDELKQSEMKAEFKEHKERLRFFIGDVRDLDRLIRASQDVNYIIHAAALKQVDTVEYNPFEAVRTNVQGAINISEAAITNGCNKVVALSTDKACLPVNFYGGTKFLSDKIFQSANVYSRRFSNKFCIVRYGNVAGSRGSIIPVFRKMTAEGKIRLPVTHEEMTRFWTKMSDAIRLVMKALEDGQGGEIFVGKAPSFKVTNLVKAFNCSYDIIGIREGEKLHEQMVTDLDICYDYGDHFRLYPNYDWYSVSEKITGTPERVKINYTSDNNHEWLSVTAMRGLLEGI